MLFWTAQGNALAQKPFVAFLSHSGPDLGYTDWTIKTIFIKNKNFDNSISSTYQQKDTIIEIDKVYLCKPILKIWKSILHKET